ncbi:hypothetical protein ACLI4Z_05890 [Natrialbaceae archaeon A-arb3/5]
MKRALTITIAVAVIIGLSFVGLSGSAAAQDIDFGDNATVGDTTVGDTSGGFAASDATSTVTQTNDQSNSYSQTGLQSPTSGGDAVQYSSTSQTNVNDQSAFSFAVSGADASGGDIIDSFDWNDTNG